MVSVYLLQTPTPVFYSARQFIGEYVVKNEIRDCNFIMRFSLRLLGRLGVYTDFELLQSFSWHRHLPF